MNSKVFLLLGSVFFASFIQAQEPQEQKSQQEQNRWTLEASTENGFFVVSLWPKAGTPIIGDYHDWIIEVTDENNKGIENAEFSFGGGMAAHEHGLPSQPKVSRYLGDGEYLVEGMLFNMAGDWTLIVAIRKDEFTDRATFEFKLDF